MNRRAKLFIPVAVFLTMAGLLWMGLGRDPNIVPSALIDRPVPAFSLPGLLDPERTYTQEDLQGEIFVLNVWATWCVPCHIEHPFFMEISQEREDLTFVGVNYKNPEEGEAEAFLAERGNPFDLVIVDLSGRLGIDLGVTAAPETFVIDTRGNIRYRHVGIVDRQMWDATFAPLIARLRAGE